MIKREHSVIVYCETLTRIACDDTFSGPCVIVRTTNVLFAPIFATDKRQLTHFYRRSKQDDRYVDNDVVHEPQADTPVLAKINPCAIHCELHVEEQVFLN